VLYRVCITGVVLLFCTSAPAASFFSDLLRGPVAAVVEQQEVAKAPGCTLSADDALVQAIELLSDGRQAEAEDFIKSAVKSHRDDVRILFAKAVLERSRWDKDAADVWFAMARKAKGAEHLSRAAWLSMKLDRHESIDENMAELIRLSDENPGNVFLLWQGAIQCREQSRHTSSLPVTQRKQMAEMGKERYGLLLKHFELGPVMVHHTYANILTEDTKDYDEALEHRILAVSMEAKSWSLEGFADTLTRMGKYRWACTVWEQSLEKQTDARCYNCWGDALKGLGKYEEAAEKYREGIRLRPQLGYYWRDLALCLKKLDRDEEMFGAYQRAVDLGCEGALDDLGQCYRYGRGVEKDEEKAFELYQRYRKVKPKSTWILRALGSCYNKGVGTEKNPQKALECFEKAVALNTNSWVGLNGLALVLTSSEDPSLHDYPRAIELAKRSVAVNETGLNLNTLAVAYFKNGQYDEAVKAQERIIELWQLGNPEKPVPVGKLTQLKKYRKLQQEEGDSP